MDIMIKFYQGVDMSKFVTVQAFDGTLVHLPEEKLEEFNRRTEKIKTLIKEGKTKQEIFNFIKEGKI